MQTKKDLTTTTMKIKDLQMGLRRKRRRESPERRRRQARQLVRQALQEQRHNPTHLEYLLHSCSTRDLTLRAKKLTIKTKMLSARRILRSAIWIA